MALAKLLKRKRSEKPLDEERAPLESGPSGVAHASEIKHFKVGPAHRDDDTDGPDEDPGGHQKLDAYQKLLQVLRRQRRSGRGGSLVGGRNNVEGMKVSPNEGPLEGDEDGSDGESVMKMQEYARCGAKQDAETTGEEELDVGKRVEDDEDDLNEETTGVPDDYERALPGVEDKFQSRISSELTDEEASFSSKTTASFRKLDDPEYKDIWPAAHFHCSGCSLPKIQPTLGQYGVCRRLRESWLEVNPSKNGTSDFASRQQCAAYALMSSYQDVFIPDRPYLHSCKDSDPILDACIVHCVNHVVRSLDVHKRNLHEIVKLRKSNAEVNEANYRDRGFTCPKVLFLAPMRNAAYQIVKRVLQYGNDPRNAQPVKGMERVVDELAPDDKLEEVFMAKGKPGDYNGIFGGNVSDNFRLGIQFSRDGLACYTNLYRSDIVVASPLSLALMIAKEGVDFLSSIDILVIDRADIMMMQNWQHVVSAVKHVNRMPKAQHNVNIMRVREYFLKGHGGLYRQTIILSSFSSAEMNSVFTAHCHNTRGQVRLVKDYDGVLERVLPSVQQFFERQEVKEIEDYAEARLNFFKNKMVPKLRTALGNGILVVIPHYFDYIRVRKLLQVEEMDFCWITEYSNEKHARKCRAAFYKGHNRIMLLTERAHFYSRKRIGGISDVIFYGLPEHATYYSEIINMVDTNPEKQHTVTTLFSRYSGLQLERVVGTKRARKMLKGRLPAYMLL